MLSPLRRDLHPTRPVSRRAWALAAVLATLAPLLTLGAQARTYTLLGDARSVQPTPGGVLLRAEHGSVLIESVPGVGVRVRVRFGNLSMDSHPIHLHGHAFHMTGTDGGWLAESAWWPETTVNVPVGAARVIEFVADNPGDWPLHCHKSHHTMNAMGHGVPNMLGVKQDDLTARINKVLPNYMPMGKKGMAEMQDMAGMMPLLENTLPMMSGNGPFGPIEMGGMFTVIKIRDDIAAGEYHDPGWYKHPQGSVAHEVKG